MNYRSLGNTGMQVSEIGLGGWQLANTQDWNTNSSEQIIQKSLESGCNFFDTAPGYTHGQSELILGKTLKSVRSDIIINTKFGYSIDAKFDFSTQLIRPSLEDSLKRLQTDYIDTLLFHSPTTDLLINGISEQCEELEKLKSEGKIRAYGASITSRLDLETLLNTTKCQVVEVNFNVFDQEALPAFSQAYKQGVGLIIKVPLDSGWLAGIYNKETKFSGSRSRWSQAAIDRRFEMAEKFANLLPADISMSQAALQFCLTQSGVSTVIPGAETVEQALDNFSAINKHLAPEVIQAIRDLWQNEISSNRIDW